MSISLGAEAGPWMEISVRLWMSIAETLTYAPTETISMMISRPCRFCVVIAFSDLEPAAEIGLLRPEAFQHLERVVELR